MIFHWGVQEPDGPTVETCCLPSEALIKLLQLLYVYKQERKPDFMTSHKLALALAARKGQLTFYKLLKLFVFYLP